MATAAGMATPSPSPTTKTHPPDTRTVRELFDALRPKLEEITALDMAQSTLSWDQLVMMPPQAGPLRSQQLAVLAGVTHERRSDPALGKLIKEIVARKDSGEFEELGEYERSTIRLAHRSYLRDSLLPTPLATRMAALSSRGYEVWATARERSDWGMFVPVLREWVECKRDWKECVQGNVGGVYDFLLDGYEIGFTSARLDVIFAYLKKELIPLIRAVSGKPPPDTSFMQGAFDVDEQTKVNHRISRDMGFDTTAGRLDTSLHPFTTGSSVDVRMTTRYKPDELMEGITGTVHETGHALYDQGINKEYAMLPGAWPLSTGVHESQSLFWERMICLSPEFWHHYAPILREHFPTIPAVPISAWHRAVNASKPGFIRVEADELTYPMHVILRYEIERDLVEGMLDPVDVPKVWADKIQEYLGITPPNDAVGALQDMHWGQGLVGYFPTYTLGAIMASMFYKKAQEAIPDLSGQVSRGEFKQLREWLRVKIHNTGSLCRNADELCVRVCGSPIDPELFVNYLKDKFGKLYGVDAYKL
ncbi:Zn-dependent carboxypeptidase [Gonapodya prolifera JEL478]|uniref:Zn-dependent carboxypeptidase n=1 Tax=Gonapodya prolifera (strain JEL478) TaxID=1344416 RepID=A0A139AX48_GONPJ|nr:Zn-dependent carboxypeptidase [Gonapodya prolifera JEL478]|eukprot:KXS21287.1 Zn-dependent carboxypeptidase [Gonapodya prolifera JEL478]